MIDVTFDFTTDSPGYWDGFWENNDGFGAGGSDPDSSSPTLQEYHRALWSRELPDGQKMELKKGSGSYYLTWKDFRFASDSIIVGFRYQRYRHIIEQVMSRVVDYKGFYEDFLRKSYTIGGMIIFPKHRDSINQKRGTNRLIADRWDLTLECIRKYYLNEDNPLMPILKSDKAFFDLFIDFKGYVDFFLLQDCVSDDYSCVDIWDGKGDFTEDGLPKTVDDYFHFIDREFAFLADRNKRIEDHCKERRI